MLYDGLSWVLSVEPPAPCARLSPSQSVSLCLLRGPLLPHLLFIVVPQTFPPLVRPTDLSVVLSIFFLSFPLTLSALSLSFGCVCLSYDALTSSFHTQPGFLKGVTEHVAHNPTPHITTILHNSSTYQARRAVKHRYRLWLNQKRGGKRTRQYERGRLQMECFQSSTGVTQTAVACSAAMLARNDVRGGSGDLVPVTKKVNDVFFPHLVLPQSAYKHILWTFTRLVHSSTSDVPVVCREVIC